MFFVLEFPPEEKDNMATCVTEGLAVEGTTYVGDGLVASPTAILYSFQEFHNSYRKLKKKSNTSSELSIMKGFLFRGRLTDQILCSNKA